MTESAGLALEELEAETGEELPPRELMACVVVGPVFVSGVTAAGQFVIVCATVTP